MRWEQELAIDELKTHERERPVLRSQTPAGVVQEIYGLLLAHYVVRGADARGGRQRAGAVAAAAVVRATLKIHRSPSP